MKPLTRADGVSVGRLGHFGHDTTTQLVDQAYRSGVDYFFAYFAAFDEMIRGLSMLGRRHREKIVIAAGGESRNPDADQSKWLEYGDGMDTFETRWPQQRK